MSKSVTTIDKSTKTNVFPPLQPLLDQQIKEITKDLPANYERNLRLLNNQQNISTIVKYVKAIKIETSVSDHYRRENIDVLRRFSRFNHEKHFNKIMRDDVIAFLDSHRRSEAIDPLHQWIGTYNLYRMYLFRFFKWLYYPNIEHKKRPTPSMLQNISKLKRKEISIYTANDMWTAADDLLFLKYCPHKRDRCYHAVSRDLSCRPVELLKLKIGDVAFKSINNSQYAEVTVNGKTGQRPIPLINSIPYLKDYLDHEHPMPNNKNAPLICGTQKSFGRHLSTTAISHMYEHYKKKVFPSLLELPSAVPPEDKHKIRELLKKHWNPYVRRHSALTEKSKYLKEHVLRQHSGWSARSQMHLKYLHYYGDESNSSILEEYGLMDKGVFIDQLRPKQCPNCQEGNKPDSKFCGKCRMVLSYDAYEETLKEQEKQRLNLDKMEQVLERINKLEDKILNQ